jgi:hypothetical protein
MDQRRQLRCSGTSAEVGVQVPLGPVGSRSARTQAAVVQVRASDLALRAAEAELTSSIAADRADRAALQVERAAGGGRGGREAGGVAAAAPLFLASRADAAADARAQRAGRRGEGGATAPAVQQSVQQLAVHDRSQRALARQGGDRGDSADRGSRGVPLPPAPRWRSTTAEGRGGGACAAREGPVSENLGGGWSKVTTLRRLGGKTDLTFVLRDGAEGGGDLILSSAKLMHAEIASREMQTRRLP